MQHLTGLHPRAGGSWGRVVSKSGMVGPRGSRVVSPLGDCIFGDSRGGPSPETCHHAVTVTLGLAWALRVLTGWSVQVVVWGPGDVRDLSE